MVRLLFRKSLLSHQSREALNTHNMEKLKLQFPLKYWSVNQKFGANDTSIYAKLGMKGHNGLDLHAPDSTSVYASHDGRVTFAGYDSSLGPRRS